MRYSCLSGQDCCSMPIIEYSACDVMNYVMQSVSDDFSFPRALPAEVCVIPWSYPIISIDNIETSHKITMRAWCQWRLETSVIFMHLICWQHMNTILQISTSVALSIDSII